MIQPITASEKNVTQYSLQHALSERAAIRLSLIIIALAFLCLFLFIPLVVVFYSSFSQGAAIFFAAVKDPATLSAVYLTFITVLVAIPLNLIFGLSIAWAITKFSFRGKSLLVTLIDVPLTVSPVISGTIFILLFGTQGLLGQWLTAHGIKVIFAIPGILIATVFVTLPYVARELLPLMQSQGCQDEEAAITLGANGWQTFRRITLPNIRWGLLYGIILSTARTVGEFGAVSVVSGHIRGKTVTMPLQVEILYNEYNFAAAFAVASLLTIISLGNLALKKFSEWKKQREMIETEQYLANGKHL